jgi:hypothetical protein
VAGVVVFNTRDVRENADSRHSGNLSHLIPVKAENPRMQNAGSGCLAQKEKDRRSGEILAGPAASSGSASPAHPCHQPACARLHLRRHRSRSEPTRHGLDLCSPLTYEEPHRGTRSRCLRRRRLRRPEPRCSSRSCHPS